MPAEPAQLAEEAYVYGYPLVADLTGAIAIVEYDMPDYYLVANPIERYSIGDRTPGLNYADDGSLTIYIQHEEPSEEATKANWLPAPAGDFRPALRMYQPDDTLLDGSYELPAIERAP